MKKLISNKTIFTTTFAVLFFTGNTVRADELVKISELSLEESKQVTAGHVWKCEWKDKHYSGTKDVIYEEKDVTKKRSCWER